jgi:CheY-like chemotaxis protein
MDVLVVDDKDTNRKLLRSMLAIKGYNVIEADSGSSAISLFQQHHPAIVLMDIMMPDMNGYEATHRIKMASDQAYTPVIFVTALKPEEAIKKATEAGGDDFVCKPINFEILDSKINAHMRIRELNQKLSQANRELTEYNHRLQQEHEIVEHIFSNALKYSWLDQNFIRYYVSPVSAFNGDVLLAERKPDGGLCVLLGDFTGHGLPAAMGTLPVVKAFFTMVRKGIAVSEIAAELNATLKMLLPGNMFCSAIILDMDRTATQMTIWSGGLPEMILHDPDTSTTKRIECQHMPLGILAAHEFEKDVTKIPLTPGSRFYIYTDGIIETENARGERYGIERMTNIIASNPAGSFDALLADHNLFHTDSNQQDDLTLVEINCVPLPEPQ